MVPKFIECSFGNSCLDDLRFWVWEYAIILYKSHHDVFIRCVNVAHRIIDLHLKNNDCEKQSALEYFENHWIYFVWGNPISLVMHYFTHTQCEQLILQPQLLQLPEPIVSHLFDPHTLATLNVSRSSDKHIEFSFCYSTVDENVASDEANKIF